MKRLLFLATLTAAAFAQDPEVVKPGQGAKLAVPSVPGANPVAAKSKKESGPTVIVSDKGSFKSSSQVAEFSGTVNVKGPGYGISCDRLSIKLKKKPAPGTTPVPAPAAKPGEESALGDDIEEAIAEGNVVITQDKPGKDGGAASRYLATGQRAVFSSGTNALIITGWPKILDTKGGKPVKQTNALEAGARVTLFQSNDMNFDGGRSEVILFGDEKNKDKE